MSSPSRRPRLRTKSPESSTVFSEAKLVRAIQTLDSTWKRTTEEKTDASPLSDLLREALCTLLEIAACFDTPDLVQMSQLETVCTARVLGCLKRFVAGMQPSLGECCDCKCEQRLIHLTLLSILFRMCREPEVAGYVVREDLHKFLLKMSMIHNSDLTSGMNPKQDDEIHQDDVAFDPHDLMITIDPFDWCYQPLCSRLFKENNHAVFIPMGIRPLVCLLRGIGLPTDEVSEFEQRIHQPFSEWIKSLPTLESLQLERQYQQEMRQRQILEQQYQRETQRRRERNECILMQGNDFNVPEENELSIRQQKHQQFLCMQAEIRALEQRDSNEEKNICRTEASTREPTIKETRVIQERLRLLQLDDQRREGRELEKMCREDLYYVERILRAKANAKEEQEKRERSGDLQKNVIQEQQRHIARMRLLDEEKRLAERESSGMRLEDLFGRQIRLREAEKAKEELNHDWRERKTMQAEEHDCRSRWTLWERALIKQQQEELKILRVEERRRKRQQQREEREIRVAWVENWDIGGNKYYYNSITGISQWEVPDQF
ncbi:hypothetical protein PC112_g1133 [Phytophthora cactorum]|nr:hypothetical protein PC112_g1133 [Phytophthora cactorum]